MRKEQDSEIDKSVGAVVFHDDRFLIVRRADNGRWEVPKGHQKADETEKDTVRREVHEELGIVADGFVGGFREERTYVSSSSGKLRVLVFYLVQYDGPIMLSDEHTEYRWVTVEQSKEYFSHPGWIDLLQKAFGFVK